MSQVKFAYDQLIFVALANPVRKELLDAELRTWGREQVQKLIDDYYSNDGWDVDDDLKYILSADKLKLTNGGFALKKAILDHLREIYFDELEMTTFLEDCGDHLRRVQRINMESLLQMCSAGFDKHDLFTLNFRNLPDYLKAIDVAGALLRATTEKELAPLPELGPYWEKFYAGIDLSALPKGMDLAGYEYFSQVLDRLSRVKLATANRKIEPFGIEVYETRGGEGSQQRSEVHGYRGRQFRFSLAIRSKGCT